ncbi:MAG: hypothetical protein QXI54_09130 [Archaeoglobaceae archaeon]
MRPNSDFLLQALKYRKEAIIFLDGFEIVSAIPDNVFGYPNSDLVGKNILSFFRSVDVEEKLKILQSGTVGELRFESLFNARERPILVDLFANMCNKQIILQLRDISKEKSLNIALKATIETLKLLPSGKIEKVVDVLKNYFEDVKIEVVSKRDPGINFFSVPLNSSGTPLGSLCFKLPEWFILDDEILGLFDTIAYEIGESFTFKLLSRSTFATLDLVKESINHVSFLVDRIRNPLAVIYSLAELEDSLGKIGDRVKVQVERIVNYLIEVERDWKKLEELERELRNTLIEIGFTLDELSSPFNRKGDSNLS